MTIAGLVNKRFAYLCEMGTGKTKVQIDILSILKLNNQANRCLVICPKSVMENWQAEIKKNSKLN